MDRGYRKYIDYVHATRQAILARRYGIKVVMGRFRKHNATNCGQSCCNMCANPRRTRGRITLKEESANQQLNVLLAEYFQVSE